MLEITWGGVMVINRLTDRKEVIGVNMDVGVAFFYATLPGNAINCLVLNRLLSDHGHQIPWGAKP